MTTLDLDPEVAAMQSIIDNFGPLSESARQRVLAWAMDRFGLEDEDEPAALPIRTEPPAPALPRQVRPIDSYPPGFGDR